MIFPLVRILLQLLLPTLLQCCFHCKRFQIVWWITFSGKILVLVVLLAIIREGVALAPVLLVLLVELILFPVLLLLLVELVLLQSLWWWRI